MASGREIRPESITPISAQMRLLLLREIREGRFRAGTRIPSERELAEQYGISRTSVRESVTQLVSEKVLVRDKRRGTFVASHPASEPPPAQGAATAYLVSRALFDFFTLRNSRILLGAQESLQQRGYSLGLHTITDEARAGLPRAIARHGRPAIGGCIVSGRMRHQVLDALRAASLPTVVVDREAPPGFDEAVSVRADYTTGTRLAIEHLCSLGHRRIGFIGFSDSQKYQAYCDSLRALDLPAGLEQAEFLDIFDLPPAILAGYQAMRRLLAGGRPPTALLVHNDLIAVGVMEALRIAGLEVPRDVSVVGFDDLGQSTTPPLARIRADLVELGRAAAESLIKRMHKEPLESRLFIPVELVPGRSTAPPRGE